MQPIAVFCKDPELSVYWTLTDFCNFSCNYCPAFLHSGEYHKGISKGFPTDEQIVSFVDKLEELSRTRKLEITLSGGEPTLHPMLPYIIDRLRGKCTMCITSNGSRGNDWWETILPVSSVQLSLHPEFTKPYKINSLSRLIVDSGTILRYNLSCDPNNWEKVLALYDALDDEFKLFVTPRVLQQWGSQVEIKRESYLYSEEQSAWIANTTKKHRSTNIENMSSSKMFFSDGSSLPAHKMGTIALNEWNDFKGWKCYAGSQSINATYSGDVFAGVCGSKFLGKIDRFELFDEYIICDRHRCTCLPDIRANKQLIIPE